MRKILLLMGLLVSANCFAQKVKEYKATNGITYKVGDTVKLGKGSGTNGKFLFFQLGSWKDSDYETMGSRDFTNTGVVIKKIKAHQFRGNQKMVFTVGGGRIINYFITIEDAIEACEVTPCGHNQQSLILNVADDLIKLKQLLDAGAITPTEYETEKKKLLEK